MIEWFEKHRKLSLLITLWIAVFIFYMSSLTFSSGGGGSSIKAVVYHVGIFFILEFFLLLSIANGKHSFRLMLIAFLLAVMYGITDEIHQFFVPGRYTSLKDVGYNSLGVFYAFSLYLIRSRIKNNSA